MNKLLYCSKLVFKDAADFSRPSNLLPLILEFIKFVSVVLFYVFLICWPVVFVTTDYIKFSGGGAIAFMLGIWLTEIFIGFFVYALRRKCKQIEFEDV